MKNARIFLASTLGLAIAAACGGSSSNNPSGDGGSDSSSGSSSGAGSGSAGSDAARDGNVGMRCASASDCQGGTVCCQSGGGTCQMQSSCGMAGNRQICSSNADCPAMYPVCRTSGGGGGDAGATMTCRTPTACSAASCTAMGQVCCTSLDAGVPACQASCAAGSSQVCAMKSDCPSGQECCIPSSGMMETTCNSGTCPAGTNPACATAADCATGLVCCQMGCQVQSACGMSGNRQYCTSNADCPAAYSSCRTSGGGTTTYCRIPLDGGTSPTDSGPTDTGPDGQIDGSTDSATDAPTSG